MALKWIFDSTIKQANPCYICSNPHLYLSLQQLCGTGNPCSDSCLCPSATHSCSDGLCKVSKGGQHLHFWANVGYYLRELCQSPSLLGNNMGQCSLELNADAALPLSQPLCGTNSPCSDSCACPSATNKCVNGICKVGCLPSQAGSW